MVDAFAIGIILNVIHSVNANKDGQENIVRFQNIFVNVHRIQFVLVNHRIIDRFVFVQ